DRATVDWVGEWLGLEPLDHFGRDALRHLVAVQLAPRQAITYDTSNPVPRWRLVEAYLAERTHLSDIDREEVARTIAVVLDHAAVGRHSNVLTSQYPSRCAICRLPFYEIPMSVSTKDPYKPIWRAPDELCRPEIDHIAPVSSLGRHSPENVQI